MENEEGWFNCALLNGSSWGVARALVEGRKSDAFRGLCVCVEHSLRGENADQEWNKWAQKCFNIAAAEERSTKEVENEKCTKCTVLIVQPGEK